MQLFQFLAENTPTAIAFAGMMGLLVGSFMNVVIYRLPVMMEREWVIQCKTLLEADNTDDGTCSNAGDNTSDNAVNDLPTFNLITPNSRCPECDAPIKAWQNIPVASYLMLGGKCHHCKTPISKRYPIIEFVTGLLSCLVIWHFGATWQGGAMLLLTWALVTLTMIDFDHQLLPDSITLPFLWIGLIANSFGLFCSLPEALWGAFFGYLSLWSVYWLFKLVTGKEGMGHGDFKLLAVLGAWFGWQLLPMIILSSSLVGAVVGILLLILKNRGKSVPIPFGPYLAAAGFIAAIWGEEITRTYLNYAGL